MFTIPSLLQVTCTDVKVNADQLILCTVEKILKQKICDNNIGLLSRNGIKVVCDITGWYLMYQKLGQKDKT